MAHKDLGEFKGIESGQFYRAVRPHLSARNTEARFWRVITYTDPSPVGRFIAHSVGRCRTTLRFEGGEVEIIDKNCRLVKSALPYLVALLSDDEVVLLQLFGVDLAKLVRRSK